MPAPQFHPATQIPIPTPKDGIWPSASVRFDDTSTRLLIQYHTPLVNFKTLWAHHAVDICGVVSIILILFLAWLLIHVLRRPQVVGRFYCRKCNYEIADAARTPLCPECGTSLDDRPPIAGRSAVRRPLLKFILLIPLLLLSLFTWKNHIERPTPKNITWPLASLRNFKWWPIATPVIPVTPLAVLGIYSIPDAREISRSTFDIEPWTGGITSDFHYFTRVQSSSDTLDRSQVVVYDLSRGEKRFVDLCERSKGTASFQGISADGKLAVFTTLTAPQSGFLSQATVYCVTLETAVVRELAHFENLEGAYGQTPTIAAAVSTEPEQVALLLIDGPQAGKLFFSPIASPTRHSVLQIDPDPRFGNTTAISFIDASTIRLVNSILPQQDISLNDGSVARHAAPTEQTIQFRNGLLEILRDSKPIRKITLDPSFQSSTGLGAFSPDGRWLAYPLTRYGTNNVIKSEVILIDLTIPDSPQPQGP